MASMRSSCAIESGRCAETPAMHVRHEDSRYNKVILVLQVLTITAGSSVQRMSVPVDPIQDGTKEHRTDSGVQVELLLGAVLSRHQSHTPDY